MMRNPTLAFELMKAQIEAMRRAHNLRKLRFRDGTPPRLHLGKDRSLGNMGVPFVTAHMAMRAANKGFAYRP